MNRSPPLSASASRIRVSHSLKTKSPDPTPDPTDNPEEPPQATWPLVLLCAVSVVICYADRSTIATAILPMAQQYDWDKKFQGWVLSTFFFGYAATQLAGGQLADRAGAKNVLTAGVLTWSLFTFLTPTAAAFGTAPLFAARLGLGLGEGVAFPAIHSLISRHVPLDRQSTAVGVVTAASYLGAAAAFQLTPIIIRHFSWEDSFTFISSAGLIWLPFWLLLPLPPARVDPKTPSCSLEDLALVGSEGTKQQEGEAIPPLSQPRGFEGSRERSPSKGLKGPLGALLMRKEVWAICIAQYCGSWGLYTLLNWLPTYFNEVYSVKVEDTGSYTFLPYLVQGGIGVAAGVAADRLLTESKWRKRDVRLLLQGVGMLGPAACLLFASSDMVTTAEEATSVITIGLGLSALTLGGVSANHLDVAPASAGTVFGAGNTAACVAGLVSVPVTGWLLDATGSWPLVLGVTAGHYCVGALLYYVWMGAEVLPEDRESA
eukprot:CAMPEP_0197866514 /NCGR_PEP_ID=MMETSP1438-20131217/44255_1 /TAXON_ID=1461541 /ORGANISM="Pterosperma sp., Strain CCMP1384" /LENGTH=487 /DNA_ID=CAMNT_0043485085 /DNA_START=895 /DNA_END=2358 /DNA_ORIENTATION=-